MSVKLRVAVGDNGLALLLFVKLDEDEGLAVVVAVAATASVGDDKCFVCTAGG